MRDEEDIPSDSSALIRLGTIIAVTLNPPRCRVRFGDPDCDADDTETPPVRWLNGRAGKTRSWSPPSVGEEVVLLAPDGQIGNAVALCGLSNVSAPPPSAKDLDLVEYADGARIGYDPSAHALTAILPAGSSARIEAETITWVGKVKIEGELRVTGDIAGDADVKAGSISLKNHLHSGVQAGAAKTQKPE